MSLLMKVVKVVKPNIQEFGVLGNGLRLFAFLYVAYYFTYQETDSVCLHDTWKKQIIA